MPAAAWATLIISALIVAIIAVGLIRVIFHLYAIRKTLVTTTGGRKSSAPLMSSARWLWSRCCHHCRGTNSGRMTVT